MYENNQLHFKLEKLEGHRKSTNLKNSFIPPMGSILLSNEQAPYFEGKVTILMDCEIKIKQVLVNQIDKPTYITVVISK